MRRDAPPCRAAPSERGAGKSGSAAQNLPRFSSTATTAPEALFEDFSPDLSEAFPDFPIVLPEDFPVDLRGELT